MTTHVPSVELLDALAALESRAWTEDGHTAVLERNAAAARALAAGWDADAIAAHLGVWSSDVRRWAAAAPAVPRQATALT